MKQIYKIDSLPDMDEAYLTIGNFDGIHIAHQRILSALTAKAGRKPKIVISFCEAPRKIIQPERFNGYLMPVDVKNRFLSHMGMDYLVCPDFSKIKEMTADRFLDYLSHKLKTVHLVVGYDSLIGKDRKDVNYIVEYFKTSHPQGSVETVEQMFYHGTPVSSTAIRHLVRDGDLSEANRYLGRPYLYYSYKVKGDHIGERIGFPTLNIAPNEQVLPRVGVYFTFLYVNRKLMPAMSYVGYRPTVKGKDLRIETHIIDFQGDLPDDFYPLLFIKRIRGEKTLNNVEELKNLLYNDRTMIRRLYQSYGSVEELEKILSGLFPAEMV